MPIHETADVDPSAQVASSAVIWHYAQIREGASVGPGTSIGRGVYLGQGVSVGGSCKIQNFAMIYDPAVLAHGVFVGPGVIFTNDRVPRAVEPNGRLKSANDWKPVGVTALEGSSIGAGAVCIAPVRIGSWAMIGAGSVVTRDVADFALVVGSPAIRVAWVGKTGAKLVKGAEPGRWTCPDTLTVFEECDRGLREVPQRGPNNG